MRILLLSRYTRLGASSRLRYYQYIPYLRGNGIEVVAAPLFQDQYVKDLYTTQRRHTLPVLWAYFKRILSLAKASRFDLVWLEYELFPWLPAALESWLGRLRAPYVVDYDDALFHRYELHSSSVVRRLLGEKIDRVMQRAALVIAGNDYIADRAKRVGARRVAYIPTVVDLDAYHVAPVRDHSTYTIGWVGSPVTAPYVRLIADALRAVSTTGAQVALIGAGDFALDGVAAKIVPWSETTEVTAIQQLDVGIMPVPDEPWERGKCGYKLIQYMACGRPVVASPVGANAQIVEHGVNGFLATTTDQWIAALQALRDESLRARLGAAGRAKVVRDYSLQATLPRLVSLLRNAAMEHLPAAPEIQSVPREKAID